MASLVWTSRLGSIGARTLSERGPDLGQIVGFSGSRALRARGFLKLIAGSFPNEELAVHLGTSSVLSVHFCAAVEGSSHESLASKNSSSPACLRDYRRNLPIASSFHHSWC